MQNNAIDLTKLSVTELEALAYRVILERDQAQNNLALINQEIAKRNAVAPLQPVEAKVEEKPNKKTHV